ncbi:S1C family serine protease [Aquabacterium humicola]|uniref:S1C family serine protease n=1 Tax=Aquabacterium humicola TaxID=3237377 RepID=UPI0025439CE3|nr:trypsin-like peptidase domain-containing protein [Rubrivivax pictus]
MNTVSRIARASAALVTLVTPLLAAGADLPKVKAAEPREPIVVAAQPGAPSVVFRKLVVRATNARIGTLQTGWFCGTSNEARFTPTLGSLLTRDAGRIVAAELVAAGYPKPATQDSVFATPAAPAAADYEVGVLFKDVQIEVCERDKVVEGGVWLQMAWELFSPRQQKTVFSLTTEGSIQVGSNDKLSLVTAIQRAVAMAARNLLADPAFSELARKPIDPSIVAAAPAGPPRLRIAHAAGAGEPSAQDRMPQLQSAVVTLQSGTGTGSGFYIHADGYLLTNHHVVGDARFLKVKLANGRTLVGEVMRSDRARDVALVKTEPVTLAAISVRADEVQAGEDVYAIGSPLGESFATTVTRGVLSGTRMVGQQRWLQSDVKILPGSSGGPLIGAHGAAIGLTSRGIGSGTAGINLFVPIREALDTLSIDISSD